MSTKSEKIYPVICRVSVPHYHPGTQEYCGGYTKKRDLAQKDHWVANERKFVTELDMEFPVVMPPRDEAFVELTKTMWHKLMRGQEPKFSGPIQIKLRHLHCDAQSAQKMGLKDGDMVSIQKKDGLRPGRLDRVVVRVDKWSTLEVHLDTDEANALFINDGDEGDLIIPPAPSE